MKTIRAIVLCALLLLFSMSAFADVDLSNNPVLTDQALLKPIRQTEYVNWKLYQPTSSEIVGADMTNDGHFQDRHFFPVVAVQGDRAVLILLQRAGENWAIHGMNETALNRPGLTLSQFTIDSNNRPDDTGLPVYFGFFDSEQAHYQLGLTATDVYTTRFDFLNFAGKAGRSPKAAEYLFADSFMLFFNSGFIFSYDYLYPTMRLQYSMHILTGESEYDNFATFDLGKVPWSIFDAMEECTAYSDASLHEGKILLKQFGNDASVTLCEIPKDTRLLREADQLNLENRDWVLVAYGQTLGYLPKSNVIQ